MSDIIPFDTLKQRVITVLRKAKSIDNAYTPSEFFHAIYNANYEDFSPEDALFMRSRVNNALTSLRRTHYVEVCAIGYGANTRIFIPQNVVDVSLFDAHNQTKIAILKKRKNDVREFVQKQLYTRFGEKKSLQ